MQREWYVVFDDDGHKTTVLVNAATMPNALNLATREHVANNTGLFVYQARAQIVEAGLHVRIGAPR